MKKNTGKKKPAAKAEAKPSPEEMLKKVQAFGAPFKSVDEMRTYVGAMEVVYETEDRIRKLIAHPVSRSLMLDNLKQMIFELEKYDVNRTDKDVGRFLFDVGLIGGTSVINLSVRAPAWLAEFAAKKCVIPWIYANGKPFPLFDEQDARLKWGSKIIKRGKTRADAHSTFQVLICMDSIIDDIEYMKRDRAWMMYHNKSIGDNLSETVLRASKLPLLSKETRGEWWDEVKLRIRELSRLPVAYRKSIEASVGNAESSIMNEHLKRCKRAFFALVQ